MSSNVLWFTPDQKPALSNKVVLVGCDDSTFIFCLYCVTEQGEHFFDLYGEPVELSFWSYFPAGYCISKELFLLDDLQDANFWKDAQKPRTTSFHPEGGVYWYSMAQGCTPIDSKGYTFPFPPGFTPPSLETRKALNHVRTAADLRRKLENIKLFLCGVILLTLIPVLHFVSCSHGWTAFVDAIMKQN